MCCFTWHTHSLLGVFSECFFHIIFCTYSSNLISMFSRREAVVPKEGWSCISPTNAMYGGRGQSVAVGGPAQHEGALLLERQRQ